MFQFHCEINKITRHTQVFELTTYFLTFILLGNKTQGCAIKVYYGTAFLLLWM